MSISRPQNRTEFRQYILTKLGAPVIEINVAQEQIDIAIDDAFQYFNERSHSYGTENMYLTFTATSEFVTAFSSFETKNTNQTGKGDIPIPGRPTESAEGMVDELTLITPGAGYPPNYVKLNNNGTTEIIEADITTQTGDDIETETGDNIVYDTSSFGGGQGTGLSVLIGPQRTTKNGITTVTVSNTGSGYKVGDVVSIQGNTNQNGQKSEPALFEVSKIKTESPVSGSVPITIQNNYLVLPDDVVGVNGVMRSVNTDLVGIFPGGSVFPIMLGGMLGNSYACGDMGYDLVSYVSMRGYMSTLEFLFFPPIQYSFNPRTHRLFIDSNNFRSGTGAYGGGTGQGKIIAIDCMVKPSPDVYPDLYNDMWLKEYAVALVKCQWGRNLTKFQQVQLPGGITMNGDQILSMGREDVKTLRERFAMDWADPVLDEVG